MEAFKVLYVDLLFRLPMTSAQTSPSVRCCALALGINTRERLRMMVRLERRQRQRHGGRNQPPTAAAAFRRRARGLAER